MSDIIVKFKPQGEKRLINAINLLKGAQVGATIATNNHRLAIGRNRKAMAMYEQTLSTVRSRLLVYNFAMAMGIRQTVEFARQAGKVNSMKNAFVNLSGGTENAAMSMVKLQSATNGTMNQMDLLQQANSAMVLGVTRNTDEMSEMFDMAQRLGRALGVDTARSIESLVTGLGRQSVKMLDNIGIIVKSNEAYEDYADANGLVASQLNDTQKRQAFFNAALTSGRKKMKELGPEIFTVQDSFDRFKSSLEDLSIVIGNLVGPTLQNMMDSFSDMVFELNAGPTEKLIREFEDAGVATEDFTFMIQALNEEIRENEKMSATAASGAFVSNFTNAQGTIAETTKFLEDYDLSLKTIETTQDFLQASVRGLIGSYAKSNTGLIAMGLNYFGVGDNINEATIKVVDFTNANQETILAMEKRLGVIQRQLQTEQQVVDNMELRKKKNIELSQAEERVLKTSKEKVNSLLAENEGIKGLIPSLKAYVGQLETVKKSTEENTETFATELKAIDKKSLLQEKLLKVQQDLETVMNKANVDAAEKKLSDEEALKLKEKEINIKNQLIKLDEDEAASALKTSLTKKKVVSQAFSALSDLVGMNEKYAKAAAGIQAAGAVVDAFAAAQSTFAQTSKIAPPPFPQIAYAASLATGLVNARKVAMSANDVGSGGGGQKYEQGGYVGGRRHSQGGTIIEAERGEFVMSRNAVQSIGLETLNQMNKGGGAGNINISVTGNVLTQDFVEGELAESIKEAVRRGSDFGLS